MKQVQFTLKKNDNINKLTDAFSKQYDFGLVFGSPEYFKKPEMTKLFAAAKWPIIGCSTAGEISSAGILGESLVFTAVKFDRNTKVKAATGEIPTAKDSMAAGIAIGQQLKDPSLRLVFVLGTGVNVNGSELIRGIEEVIGHGVEVTGGLAGDNGEFQETYTLINGQVSPKRAVALGFYGNDLKIGFGSQGGWKPFGPARRVTKAEGNILFELDGQSALSIYEKYLGEKAKDLPASGLLYPFAIIRGENEETGLIRTILGVDKAKGSLTLAGDIPAGGLLRLMHTGTDGLVSGAEQAAEQTKAKSNSGSAPGLAILVSCVGRKLVMGEDTDEEIDAVKEILPKNSTYTGFYSYGEICHYEKTNSTVLHNQTMTITFLTE